MDKFRVTIKEPLIGGYRYTTFEVEARYLEDILSDLKERYDAGDYNDWKLSPKGLTNVVRDDLKDPEFDIVRI